MFSFVILLTSSLLLATTIAAPEPTTNVALAQASSRNPSLNAYTFSLSAEMAMKHFPWLHFRVAGIGEYVRGERYVVTFTQKPFFAGSLNQIDLAPLDPSMWSRDYIVSVAMQHDGNTTFVLRKREENVGDPHPLLDAYVTLDANESTRDVLLRYPDGQIHLTVTPAETQGFRLPATFTADIDMPGEALTAQAQFSDYTILE